VYTGDVPGTLRLQIELGADDLRHFRRHLREAEETAERLGDAAVLDAARASLERVRSLDLPRFVADRLEGLQLLVDMVADEQWALPAAVRRRALSALAYLADPQDLIPDDVPGLGFLDDAILAELVLRELRHDLDAYRDWLALDRRQVGARDGGEQVDARDFRARREALRRRARRRTRREKQRTSGGPRPSLW